MENNNFICNGCGKSFFVSRYSKVYRNGEFVLEKVHPCTHCQSTDTAEIKVKHIYNLGDDVAYGRFSSASDEKKKEILTKRANEHYRKKGKEQKREYFKKTINKLKG